MAKEKEKRGRVTPAGTAPRASARYTPPIPKTVKESPRWLPVLILTLLGLGALVIILNYIGVLPGSQSNWYLIIGLGLITAGFITATQWH